MIDIAILRANPELVKENMERNFNMVNYTLLMKFYQ